MKIKKFIYIAFGAMLIAVCSWITVPSIIPFTMQTFSVFLLLLLFNKRDSLFSILLYILLGSVGLPVFSSFKAGLGAILGVTGGYIIGFLFLALVYYFGTSISKKLICKIISLIIGLCVCYLFGSLWFLKVYSSDTPMTLISVLSICVIPYIIPDLLKLLLAIILSKRLEKIIKL